MRVRSRRRWSSLVKVLGAVLLAALLVAVALPLVMPVDYRNLFRKPEAPTNLFPLLVSARPIKRYADVIREDLYDPQKQDLSYMMLPKQAIPPTAIQDLSLVLGRVMKRDKPAGYAFTEDDFFPRGTRPGPAAAIPIGKRSLRLSADIIYDLHNLRPGDRFDLVATKKIDIDSVSNWQNMTGPIASQITLQAQLQNLLKQASVDVVAQNAVIIEPVEYRERLEKSTSLTQGTTEKSIKVQEAVVAVDPEEVAKVMQSLATGAIITCVPRSGQPGDNLESKTPGLRPANPMGSINGAGRPPQGWTVVESFNGVDQSYVMTPKTLGDIRK